MLNVDDTVAVTQNFCSSQNFPTVWRKTRSSRKRMAVKWLQKLEKYNPKLAAMAIKLNRDDAFVMYSKDRRRYERPSSSSHKRKKKHSEREYDPEERLHDSHYHGKKKRSAADGE